MCAVFCCSDLTYHLHVNFTRHMTCIWLAFIWLVYDLHLTCTWIAKTWALFVCYLHLNVCFCSRTKFTKIATRTRASCHQKEQKNWNKGAMVEILEELLSLSLSLISSEKSQKVLSRFFFKSKFSNFLKSNL